MHLQIANIENFLRFSIARTHTHAHEHTHSVKKLGSFFFDCWLFCCSNGFDIKCKVGTSKHENNNVAVPTNRKKRKKKHTNKVRLTIEHTRQNLLAYIWHSLFDIYIYIYTCIPKVDEHFLSTKHRWWNFKCTSLLIDNKLHSAFVLNVVVCCLAHCTPFSNIL